MTTERFNYFDDQKRNPKGDRFKCTACDKIPNQVIRDKNETDIPTTELEILEIINAIEKIEELSTLEKEKMKLSYQSKIRDATKFLHKKFTILIYHLGRIEKENLMLKYKLQSTQNYTPEKKSSTNQMENNKFVSLNRDTKIETQKKKTYADVIVPRNFEQDEMIDLNKAGWTTPENKKRHETLIKVNSTTDSKEAVKKLRKEIDTKNTEGGFRTIRALKNGTVLVESHTKSQQDKLKIELQNKNDISVKDAQSYNPMFLITGIEKGYQDSELLNEIIRLNINEETIEELGRNIEQKINIVARKQCRNPMKENLVLQAPPNIAKWFLKKQVIDFDLVKVHIKEHFNLAVCFKCCGFGHVSKYCTGKDCCHKCGEEHARKDCTKDDWKCPNCNKMKYIHMFGSRAE
ncbi:unnamed protein product [Brassicogethes aeneus]|uniref:Gag-like protein n=1 Tax=Brassicogethes aeneus TaxID=1431903 RepID=A0A9P0BG00_BRAAE|nr:unnamed protein product [Brassicogethes aeneus]